MGLFEVFKFIGDTAVSFMGSEIETMVRNYKREIRYKSDDEVREIARKIENGEYQRLMIMGLLFIVSIYFPFLCNICFLLHHFLRKYFFRYWSNVLLKRMIRLI